MKSLNLYFLTRDIEDKDISLYEKILSARDEEIKYRPEEIDMIKELVNNLISNNVSINKLAGFFYSFSIPQIGKEFDLLKIGINKVVLNIELKSEMIDLRKVEAQLIKNRHYLNNIANQIYSFTLIKSGVLLYIYTYDDGLKRCNFETLINALNEIDEFVDEGIERIFRPKDYLISPLNTPQKFLSDKYYLTLQQEEIKTEILKGISKKCNNIWGLTGTAGTGKTLLLYDIAKEQCKFDRTCIIHCGLLSDGHRELNSRMHDLDIIDAKSVNEKTICSYKYIFVDEAQRIYGNAFDAIINMHSQRKGICVFSYDFAQILSYAEEKRNIPELLRSRSDFIEKRLTDKIRTNREVASFIRNMINLNDKPQKRIDYKNVDVIYADDYMEADKIIDYYCTEQNYTFIRYTPSRYNFNPIDNLSGELNTHRVIGQEFDNVIFSMDNNFIYNAEGRLQGRVHPNPNYIFYKLWYQGVSRTREKLCILVIGNKELFSNILSIKELNS